jgi:hypothetical protein
MDFSSNQPNRSSADYWATLDPTEADLAGLWLLKICLLLAHLAIRQESKPGSTAPHHWNLTAIPDDLYGWMANDQPPSAGLSVWVSRVHDPAPDDPPSQWIALPTIVANGRTIQFQVNQCDIRFLNISLAWSRNELTYSICGSMV